MAPISLNGAAEMVTNTHPEIHLLSRDWVVIPFMVRQDDHERITTPWKTRNSPSPVPLSSYRTVSRSNKQTPNTPIMAKGGGESERPGTMNRDELSRELNVTPWEIDSWMLLGCPVKRVRLSWEFNVEKVKAWLRTQKIKTRRRALHRLPRARKIDRRWMGKRCPICMDKGFYGNKAGRVYTLGELADGEWHLRRIGVPCGHSVYLNYTEELDCE